MWHLKTSHSLLLRADPAACCLHDGLARGRIGGPALSHLVVTMCGRRALRGCHMSRVSQRRDSASVEAAFRGRLAELGATLLEPEWLGTSSPHRVRCAAGHECRPSPSNVHQGHGICRKCANEVRGQKQSLVAWDAFRARLVELGATLLEPEWLGSAAPHRALCAAGHECTPSPSKVQQGRGICRTCAGNDPRVAEARFRARAADLGAIMLEPKWLGTNTPHRVRCSAGHESTPRTSEVMRGGGICRTCSGKDPRVAEAHFRARLAELGATLLEPKWLAVNTPHRVRCAAGHESSPHPGSVQQGQGICRTCAGTDPRAAEAAFRARLAELGATMLEPAWLGAATPHRVRCAARHDCSPRPGSVQQGQGICRTCAGTDPRAAEAAFRARLADLGAALLEPYQGNDRPHQVRCAAGHECRPSPSSVQQGRGICRTCAGNDPRVAEANFRARLAELGTILLEPYQGRHHPHRAVCAAGHECSPTPGQRDIRPSRLPDMPYAAPG